jgi:sulfite exporter TauE/SafE
MSEIALATAFVAGLVGSTHCVAMCGGIATALGASGDGGRRVTVVLQQAGRISSYACAGAAAGGLTALGGETLAIPAWGSMLRLATAVVIVLLGLHMAFGARARWLGVPERVGAIVWRRLAPVARRLSAVSPAPRAFALGALWGWLPCGLVYSALLVAAVTGSAGAGAATMIAFGLGTLPAMAGLAFAGKRVVLRDGALARLAGAVIVACGLWTAAVPIAELTGSHAHHVAALAR